jgi:hypothetical protein
MPPLANVVRTPNSHDTACLPNGRVLIIELGALSRLGGRTSFRFSFDLRISGLARSSPPDNVSQFGAKLGQNLLLEEGEVVVAEEVLCVEIAA